MAQAGVIRNFLVALGFTIDKSKADEMKKTLVSVEEKAKILNKALLGLAVGATIAVTKTASELDKLYFSSQRIGASATNITAYGNAIAQMGGSAEGAIGSLESLAEKMRNSPGYEGQINSLGVDTKDANGAMRDRVEVMKDLSGVLSKMPAYQANAYANSLGIDQNTLLAMRDGKFMSNMDKYQKIQKELGMNDDLTKSGNDFMTEYRDLTMMTKTGFQVIVMQAGKALIPILKLLNTMIQAGISAFSQLNPAIKGVLAAGLQLGMFALVVKGLATSFGYLKIGLSVLKMFIPTLKAFRLAFLASPIGIILALAAAIGLLYDDYKTWKEGGKSLIDWSKWTGGFDKVMKKIKDFLALLEKVKDKVFNFVQKIVSDPVGAIKETVNVAAEEAKKLAAQAADALNDKIAETDTGRNVLDVIGSGVAKTLAFGGNKEAQQAVETNEGKTPITASGMANDAVKKAVDIVAGTAKVIQGAVKDGVGRSDKYSFSFGRDVDKYIKEASVKYGIDEKILRGFVKMEAGWTGKMSPTGAIGTGQFIKSTWDGLAKTKDGKEIGMTKIGNRFRTRNDPRHDKKINTMATGLLAKQNAAVLAKYGIPLTGENLYLAHNIGAATFAKALTGKGSNSDGLKAMRQNGMKKSETPQQFVNRQKAIYMRHYKTANKEVQNKDDLASFAQNSELPRLRTSSSNGNPYKDQVRSSNTTSSKNITVHQSFKTDMTINGAKEPIESANAVKRQQENQMVFMARNAVNPVMG